MVASSRDEALNAVEFYNRPGGRRPLEAYLVHMHIAWVYLLHAEFERDGVCYYWRDKKNPRRYVKIDGERKTWELEQCVKERWPDASDPVRNNLELTMRLRNKVEHRYASGLMVASAGFSQSLLLNYEDELVNQFGPGFSVGALVHIPVALSTFTREGAASLVAAQQSLPKRLQNFFVDYRSGLDPAVAEDRRFELRIELVQKRAPKSQADLAVSFVRADDLTPEELSAYGALEKTGRIVLREKERPVTNLGKLRPKAVCERVEERIPYRFRHSAEFPQAWKRLKVRPPSSATGKARTKTDERYCTFDDAHGDYVYAPAYVDLLAERCSTAEGFLEVIGRSPVLRLPGDSGATKA
jgi:hypothetical protein